MDFSAIKDLYIGSTPVQSAWLNGSKVWGRKPAVDEQSIRDAMILWYDLKKQGATNESMAENPVLRDLSGNGHDATCYNFAWSGMSGVGGYATDFNTWLLHIIDTDEVVVTDNTLNIIYRSQGYQSIRYSSLNALSIRIKTNKECLFYTVIRDIEGFMSKETIHINKDEWTQIELPALSSHKVDFRWAYFSYYGTDIIIEQETLYPHALVSDGVDDYCLVEGLPLLNKEDGYTVIAKRKWLDEDNEGNSSLITKASTTSVTDGAFMFECKHQNATQKITRSFGGTLILDNFYTDDITYQTSNSYNSTSIPQHTYTDTNKMVMFRFCTNANEYYGEFALYSLLLFNRDLTTEEIEWVKTNLIETEQ